jgi:predicted enzyme related to lactoylglutathione lyase
VEHIAAISVLYHFKTATGARFKVSGFRRATEGRTTMLKKVVYVALPVNDQDKALDFYTKVLGFEKRADSPTPGGPRFLSIGVKGQDFELALWPGTPAKLQGTAVYTIEVEDCRAAFETLTSSGVRFEPHEVLEFPWGYVARFEDPDGNLLQVREGHAR